MLCEHARVRIDLFKTFGRTCLLMDGLLKPHQKYPRNLSSASSATILTSTYDIFSPESAIFLQDAPELFAQNVCCLSSVLFSSFKGVPAVGRVRPEHASHVGSPERGPLANQDEGLSAGGPSADNTLSTGVYH